jgi:hypothetical protein
MLAESNTAPEVPLQTALDRVGDVKIHDADYEFSAGFTGLFAKSDTTLWSSFGVNFKVPQGYTGGCLVFDPAVNLGTVRKFFMYGGLDMNEMGTPAHLWDGLRFAGNHATAGLTFSDIGNVHVSNAKRALAFHFNTSAAWITTVKFRNIIAYYSDMLCETLNTAAQPVLGFSSCHFDYVSTQSNLNTYYGFKNIEGNNLLYTNCAVWDVQDSTAPPGIEPGHPGGVISSSINAGATNIYILAGIQTHSQFVNNAKRGQVRIMDAHGPVPQWDVHKFETSVAGPTNGSKTVDLNHNMGLTPDFAWAFPLSLDAATSEFRVILRDSTKIRLEYLGTPPAASNNPASPNNLTYEVWIASR